jgi:hypothetical protein
MTRQFTVGYQFNSEHSFIEKRNVWLYHSGMKLGWYPCVMHTLERAGLLNQDRACLPSPGMLHGSLQCHSLEGILQEGRLVSNIYVFCKPKFSRLYRQCVIEGK